jgi:hypothetical protein
MQDWLSMSESKMLRWVDKALEMDKFEALQLESGNLHSTSVIDMFFCLNQMKDCLNNLSWAQAGGQPLKSSPEDVEKDLAHRQMTWHQLQTRFSRIITRCIAKYCDALAKNVLDETKTSIKKRDTKNEPKPMEKFLEEAKTSFDQALDKVGRADFSSRSLPNAVDKERVQSRHRQSCIRVNNVDVARTHLNEIYEDMDVPKISDFMTAHRKHKTTESQTGELQSQEYVSGCLAYKIVQAENLLICDGNGKFSR